MRQWEIIEQGRGDYGRGMGFRMPDDPEEAYRQGCEDGYKKGYGDAMRESNGGMDYRGGMGFRDGGQGSIVEHYPQYPVRGRMGYREDGDQYPDMGERKSRDSRGRYM